LNEETEIIVIVAILMGFIFFGLLAVIKAMRGK